MPRVAATRRVSSPTPGVALRRVSGVRGAATHVVLHALHLGEARDGASQGEVLIGRSVVVGITPVLVGEDGPPGALVRVRVRDRLGLGLGLGSESGVGPGVDVEAGDLLKELGDGHVTRGDEARLVKVRLRVRIRVRVRVRVRVSGSGSGLVGQGQG